MAIKDWREAPRTRRLAGVHIDVEAARRNLQIVTDHCGRPALCVVKADAYGHGAQRVAGALVNEPACRGFAVARMEEAMALRTGLSKGPGPGGTKPAIVCLGTFLAARPSSERKELIASCRETGIEPVLASAEDCRAFRELPERARRSARFHLAVDTGMAREGVAVDELFGLLVELGTIGQSPRTIWTHFSASEEPNTRATVEQLERIGAALDSAPADGVALHVENSAASLNQLADRLSVEVRNRIVFTRLGGALYGLDLRPDAEQPRLEPVMQVRTRVVQLRELPPGRAVGYGGTWTTARKSIIGLAAIGYADGLRSPTPELIWHGADRSAAVPVIGRVSMDLATVDFTDVALGGGEPRVGDEIVVLGSSRDRAVSACDHAVASGVADYAVTVGFSLRLPHDADERRRPPDVPAGVVL